MQSWCFKHIEHKVGQLLQPFTTAPKGAVIKKQIPSSNSQKLMLEYGIIHPSTPGMFHYLPLGLRALEKLIRLIDAEMYKIGGQKLDLSCLISKELLQTTGRWSEMHGELFKLTDRQKKEFCLGPTHEEVITQLMSSLAQLSYKQLPKRLYQITKKYRDEPRPKNGLQRGREFVMKDLYSFDTSVDMAKSTYDAICSAYENIFQKLGLKYIKALASCGAIGGSFSHEYHISTELGEDSIVFCSSCDYGANVEIIVGDESPTCPKCSSHLQYCTAIEVAHTFLLEKRYSVPLNAVFQTASGEIEFLVMGCYGFGVSRLLAAALEVLSKTNQLRWPKPLVPYQICIIPPKDGSKEAAATSMAVHLYKELNDNSMFPGDVIFDDRTTMTIGSRFMQAQKTGYPYILITGKKAVQSIPEIEVHDIYNETTMYLTHSELFNYLNTIKE